MLYIIIHLILTPTLWNVFYLHFITENRTEMLNNRLKATQSVTKSEFEPRQSAFRVQVLNCRTLVFPRQHVIQQVKTDNDRDNSVAVWSHLMIYLQSLQFFFLLSEKCQPWIRSSGISMSSSGTEIPNPFKKRKKPQRRPETMRAGEAVNLQILFELRCCWQRAHEPHQRHHHWMSSPSFECV